MKIIIEARPQDQMRYDTLGDWYYDEAGDLRIDVVGECPVHDVQAFLYAFHELFEAVACRHAGVTQEMVDEFDLNYQGDGEPGDDPAAPYREQHRPASVLEVLAANYLGRPFYGLVEGD
jgi:hypothetical protein